MERQVKCCSCKCRAGPLHLPRSGNCSWGPEIEFAFLMDLVTWDLAHKRWGDLWKMGRQPSRQSTVKLELVFLMAHGSPLKLTCKLGSACLFVFHRLKCIIYEIGHLQVSYSRHVAAAARAPGRSNDI
jgi:hypothetical protein